MSVWHQRLLIAGVAIAAAGAGAWNSLQKHRPAEAPRTEVVRKLFSSTLTDANGTAQPLSQWSGSWLVVNFWASWCLPCREEMPAFSRLSQRYRDRGVHFLGLAIDTLEPVRAFQKATPVSYPLLIGGADAIQLSSEFGNLSQGMPFTVVIDPSGKVVRTRLGRYDEHELDAVLQELAVR